MGFDTMFWNFYYENDVLVRRDFFVYDASVNKKTVSWSEGPGELGTHREVPSSVKAQSIEQIFAECEYLLANPTADFSPPIVAFDQEQFSCLMERRGCADDCSQGVAFRLCPSKTELATDPSLISCTP